MGKLHKPLSVSQGVLLRLNPVLVSGQGSAGAAGSECAHGEAAKHTVPIWVSPVQTPSLDKGICRQKPALMSQEIKC